MLLEGLEDQIALDKIEDKGLDHQEHITWRQFEPGETMGRGRHQEMRNGNTRNRIT